LGEIFVDGYSRAGWWNSHFLVGGLEHFLFSIIYGIILPIDFHIFQRGRYTTNQFLSSSHLWRLRLGAPGQESWLPVETPQAGLL
jgi:hypothetical protein